MVDDGQEPLIGTNQRLVQQVIDGKVHDAKVLTIEIAEPDRPLTATVESVDPAARTAELEGTAPSAAGSVDVSWMRSGKSETKTVRVVDGHWSTRVDGLAAGANPVHVEAFDGGESLGTADVDVTVEVPPFAATVAFDDDVAKDAVIRGTGTPGAQVVIRDGSTAIGSSEVADDGSWSVSTAAPDRGGVRQVVATQTIDGQGTERVTLDVDYGAAVRITSPGDGFVPSPAFPSVRVVGQAQPGVVVHLSVRGGRELGTATADADGRWAVSTGALRESERTLDASGTSKGANTTTDDLVLGGS